MDSFMKHTLLILTQSAAMVAVFFVLEADSYMTDGYGIHPVVAGFVACLLLIVPHLLVNNLGVGDD